MAQAQNYSTTNFENKSKDSISSIDPYSFDNNLINMVDFISEDSDNLMNDYLTHDEIIKTKIILVDNDKNTFENTITDNDFLLSLREMTNLSTKEIRGSMRKYKNMYYTLIQTMVK